MSVINVPLYNGNYMMTFDKKKSLKDGPLFQKYRHHKGQQSLTGLPGFLITLPKAGGLSTAMAFQEFVFWHY